MAAVELGWTPEAFWRATPHELWAAFDYRAERAEAERLANLGR